MNDNLTPENNPDTNNELLNEAESSPAEGSENNEVVTEIISVSEDKESDTVENNTEEEKKPKKKRLLQTPVIISICLVLAVLLTYFVYTAFFLREPEGVVWKVDVPEIDTNGNTVTSTYYYEFGNDNSFKSYMGSIEIDGKYSKEKGTDNGNLLTVDVNSGVFPAKLPVKYEVTGSRILNNQELRITNDYLGSENATQYTLKQSKLEQPIIELPEDFKADEKLLGEWVALDMGTEILRVNFNDNGSMYLKFLGETDSYGLTYNGSYTVDNDTVNFTYYTTSNSVVAPLAYQMVDDNTLFFIGTYFVRANSMATADQTAK